MRRASFQFKSRIYAGASADAIFLPNSIFELRIANLHLAYLNPRNSCEHC
jgi:hypothetical protein